uniref:Prephenate dehydrogenase n=1 Tax=Muribaculaceae bacterium Z82 TaxID=2304548 RepID=A0A7C9JEH3_9BACT
MEPSALPESGKRRFGSIAIVGFGLIGASIARAVLKADPDVRILAVDASADACRKARELEIAQIAVLPGDPAFRAFVEDEADLVILAVPVDEARTYLGLLAQWSFQGLITDTLSTKTSVSKLADEVLPYPERYIPGHPMAGSEVNGIEGSRADLFEGAHWILCPDEATDPDLFASLHELVTGLGARVVSLPRADHDNAIAVVSHVPHIVASSLVQLASRHADEQRSLMRLAAGGFKDSTRIAAGSPELWCGISFDNCQALSQGLSEMQQIIQQFKDSLDAGDRAGLTSLLAEAASVRRSLPATWVPSTERLLEVRIPMTDRPGVVAEVTTIASSVGCNIQSIEIDHVTESSAVLSLVLTDEGDVGQLSFKLIDAGFAVSFSPLSAKEHVHVG